MDIKSNIEKIKREIPSNVELIAVSKTKPLEYLEEAYKQGMRHFGENKVQEMCSKYEDFHKDVKWHLIGHLQKNKVKYIVGKVHLIHSLDSVSLLQEIEKRYAAQNLTANVLIQVNIGRESQKYGILEEEICDIIKEIENCNNVKVHGIMVIIPKGDENDNRMYFRKTKELFEQLKKNEYKNISMDILSMGMTHDYALAIEEGSTMIRVGEGIFGERNYNK